MLSEQDAQAVKDYLATQFPKRLKARFSGKKQWFIVLLLVALGVIYGALNPWAFFLGGNLHPLGYWEGWGRMHSKTAGDYFLYVMIYPSMRRGSTTVPADRVKGNARLCTPKGENYYLNLGGGMPWGYYVNSLGKSIRVYMYKYRTFNPERSSKLRSVWQMGQE